MIRKATAAASIAAAALTITGCGSHGRASTTSTAARGSITRSRAASVYLADVAPVNAEGNRLGQEFTSSTSDAQLAQDARPFVTAAQKVDSEFLALARQYPAAATALKAEVRSDKLLIAGLQNPSHLTTRELQDDIDVTHTSANDARAQLGLSQHQ